MRQFTLAAATVAIAALVAAAPASAERLMGGPIKQGGQCWKSNSGGGEFDLGYLGGMPAEGRHSGDPPRCAQPHLIGLSRHTHLSAPQVTVGPFSYRDGSARGARTVTGARASKRCTLFAPDALEKTKPSDDAIRPRLNAVARPPSAKHGEKPRRH